MKFADRHQLDSFHWTQTLCHKPRKNVVYSQMLNSSLFSVLKALDLCCFWSWLLAAGGCDRCVSPGQLRWTTDPEGPLLTGAAGTDAFDWGVRNSFLGPLCCPHFSQSGPKAVKQGSCLGGPFRRPVSLGLYNRSQTRNLRHLKHEKKVNTMATTQIFLVSWTKNMSFFPFETGMIPMKNRSLCFHSLMSFKFSFIKSSSIQIR